MTPRILADRAIEILDGRTVRLIAEGRIVATLNLDGHKSWPFLRAWLRFEVT